MHKRSQVNSSAFTKQKLRAKDWATLCSLEKKINKSLTKLSHDIQRKASYKVIQKDNNEIALLLGECNYLARQWWQHLENLKKQLKKTKARSKTMLNKSKKELFTKEKTGKVLKTKKRKGILKKRKPANKSLKNQQDLIG